MKKSLTQNISRYDNKIRVRYNRRTLTILLISLAVGVVSAILFGLLLSLIYAVAFGAMITLILFGLQIIEIDGMTLLHQLKLTLFPVHFRQYEHTAARPEDRLVPDSYKENKERSIPDEKKRKEAKRK